MTVSILSKHLTKHRIIPNHYLLSKHLNNRYFQPPKFTMTTKLNLIEIGINLTDSMFRGIYREKQVHADDLDQVLQRAKAVGISKMLVTGGNLTESLEAVELCKQHPGFLYATVGCHPTRCNEFVSDPDRYLADLMRVIETNPGVVAAIGEFGLDYDRLHFCDAAVQRKYFEFQFQLSEKFQLPLFLHCRNTGTDFAEIIKANRHRFTNGVVHSFTGTYDEAKELLDLGLYIGLNGCSMKTEENLEMIKRLPLDRLMIETDALWCDIRPTHASHRYIKDDPAIPTWSICKKEKFQLGSLVKSRNEPCQLISVLVVLSKLFDVALEPLADQLYQNTIQVFTKLKSDQ